MPIQLFNKKEEMNWMVVKGLCCSTLNRAKTTTYAYVNGN